MLEDEEDEDELNVDRFRFEEGGGGRWSGGEVRFGLGSRTLDSELESDMVLTFGLEGWFGAIVDCDVSEFCVASLGFLPGGPSRTFFNCAALDIRSRVNSPVYKNKLK